VPVTDDPVLAEQMRAEAERAAEAGAAQALSEAQAAQAQALRREQEEYAQAAGAPSDAQQYNLQGEFAQYAPADRTFLTGLDASGSQANLAQQQQQQQQPSGAPQQSGASDTQGMSDEELIALVEKQMMEYERLAQYLEAEKARKHLEALKQRFASKRRAALESVQSEDVRVFFAMVAQHQQNFDQTWAAKAAEHALRAADLIDACKWRHEEAQRELYETLRRKRMPKFSVELLNMRKRQVALARSKQYVPAEKVKRRADLLEQIEVERIREAAREENQLRFQALLKKQEWERRQLAQKLHTEKRCLLEAKAQDFLRLRKRLRNAEQELKKTHVRQQLLAEKKILPLYSYNAQEGAADGAGSGSGSSAGAPRSSKFSAANGPSLTGTARGSVLRNSGMQRMMAGSGGAAAAGSSSARSGSQLKSARELTARAVQARAAAARSSSYEVQQAAMTGQTHTARGTGAAIVGHQRPGSRPQREEKESPYVV